jgi:hypothetical protein
MIPPFISPVVICLNRLFFVALFVALAAVASPFNAGPNQVGNETSSTLHVDGVLPGHDLATAEPSVRQVSTPALMPEPVPVPDTPAPDANCVRRDRCDEPR